ncbi:MAG: sugar phosphate nucleotidyltransferase [Chloroflexota bacterium]|nr:sugar phosphate nucleotidyltransferase [Chloroflexota bacterium]
MRKAEAVVALDPDQEARAGEGQKGMIPVGRPFLDHVLSGLADAGYTRVCLVIGPEHHAVREYYTGTGRPERVTVEFAIQERPLGTADAVLAAESFSAGEPFLVVNADNLYPRAAIEALRELDGPGLAGFRRSGLVRSGLIPPERILAFALIEVSADGYLTRIVEKPGAVTAREFGDDPLISMNAWRLPPTIFASCRVLTPSRRGELELQDAVRHNMREPHERYRVLPFDEGVIDLSSRADIPVVTNLLRGREVRP